MNDEGFEEWDADFLDQVIQVEEHALSSLNPTLPFSRPPPPPPPATHSPPRLLSQRTPVSLHTSNQASYSHNVSGSSSISRLSSFPCKEPKQLEIDRLKLELGRVSRQLTDLEQECSDLRKEADEKEKRLRSVFTRTESKDANAEFMKKANLEDGVHIQEHSMKCHGRGNVYSSDDHVGAHIDAGAFTRKEIGVQTEKLAELNDLMIKKKLSTTHPCSRKLLDIWDPSGAQNSRRNLVPKLLVACETDFQVLFGCLSSNPSSHTKLDSSTYKSSFDAALNHHVQPVHPTEATKVSHLYFMLTKIGYDMVKLKDLIEALVDLCGLENVMIVHKSLHVLRVLLNHVLCLENKSDQRDNVMVEANNSTDVKGSQCSETGSLFYENADETGHIETRFVNPENICKDEVLNDCPLLSVSDAEWVSLFEKMHQIVMRNTIVHVRLEAISIMNMILMRSNAYVEREKYGQLLVFQSVSQLLRKEAGIAVQKQAVHLLYLLLNCSASSLSSPDYTKVLRVTFGIAVLCEGPMLMATFCSQCKEEGIIAEGATCDVRPGTAFQGFCAVLESLADCLVCNVNSADADELKLQRNAIILLAFLASSGKCGFEIVLGHRLPKRINFLILILQILASEDSKASESIQPADIFRERTFLLREALIFLNRLVSNPQYSTPVLRALTNSRDAANLTIGIASSLSRQDKWLWQSDTMARQMRESEVVNLAGVFKKRVYAFLGDVIS